MMQCLQLAHNGNGQYNAHIHNIHEAGCDNLQFVTRDSEQCGDPLRPIMRVLTFSPSRDCINLEVC